MGETTRDSFTGSEIAIVGMSCRLPGAATIEEFWRNLCSGVESLTLLSDEDLRRAGVDPALAGNPNYVRRAALAASAWLPALRQQRDSAPRSTWHG